MKRRVAFTSMVLAILISGCKREDGPLLPIGSSDSGRGGLSEIDPPVPTSDLPRPDGPVAVEPNAGLPSDVALWAYQAVATLQSFYNIEAPGYRGSAESGPFATMALINFLEKSGNHDYDFAIQKIYGANRGTNNFVGDVFLVNGNWALTWIKAYDLTQDRRYLETAKAIAEDMETNGWTGACGGGMVTTRTTKGLLSATSAMYVQLMATLHNRQAGDTKYLERANKGWDWIVSHNLLNNANLVNNGLNGLCKNDGLQSWNHTQGYMLGAAVEMNAFNNRPEIIQTGKAIALAVIANSGTAGILREANDSRCVDCVTAEAAYKGVFIRNLKALQTVVKDPKIDAFLLANIMAAWNGARSTGDLIGFHWQSAFDIPDLLRQASGVELFSAGLSPLTLPNLAAHRVANVSESCTPNETGVQAVDETAGTEWCAPKSADGQSLIVDLVDSRAIKLFKVLHTGAYGRPLNLNNRNFTIAVGDSASGPWQEVASAVDNTSSATFFRVNVKGRFVRLNITKGGADEQIRVPEFAVY